MSSYMDDLCDDYEEISLENCSYSDRTKALCHKYENMIDFSMINRDQIRDKGDRATTDHALDKRSVAILYKMMSQGEFAVINGCISTGKEANVYHAIGSKGDLAIKVYMTSILSFKSRSKYVEGDFRMRHGYSTCSSWRLVSKWAEKEYRNLIRINKAGSIPTPLPIKLKGVVLLMTLIGKNGYPAPKLKDVASSDWPEFGPPPDWSALYRQILQNVRTLFQKCRLVHADLSEYNLLYMDGQAWLIDVSQAVEHECEQALEFLRKDCYNVNAFFRRQGANTLTLREFFEWVVDPTLPEEGKEAYDYLDTLLTRAQMRGFNQTLEIEDDAFRRVYVARRLEDVKRFFSDFKRLKMGLIKPEDLYYTAVTGVRSGLLGGKRVGECKNEREDEDSKQECKDKMAMELEEEGEGGRGGSGDEGRRVSLHNSSRRPRDESLESKRSRKKAVQAAKAEKRLAKIPKHVKKRARKTKS
ncbi:serine:threonine protein kinase RIO1 [Echinococcus multilocularis]|uniref:Serine/threonine-protein kinase RIO1 n=1 Tax=Echinococcus multilocularis TaxID=6211 RepID=A0A068Y1Y1_ECHMU|nr:serine:threonine protein kinase RIO1 [Echinococcus multilocularis]